MNALSVAWKLRVDLMQVLAAASPRAKAPDSEPRLKRSARLRQAHTKSDIRELLSGTAVAEPESEPEPLQASGVEHDRG